MRQGAVGHVRLLQRDGRTIVEKRMPDAARHDTEVCALRALAHSGLPVPELVAAGPASILMSRMPGERLDSIDPGARLEGLRASAALLRRLHAIAPPRGLPAAPDDRLTIRRYRDSGGPPLPLRVPAAAPPAFCHGDWTDGNLLAENGAITAIVDWEASHVGDPLREVSRAAWGASRKDARSFQVLADAYGVDAAELRPWLPIHAAELWLWFAETGPPEYLNQLTAELRKWPH